MSTTVNNDPRYRDNFEAAQAFIQGEISALRVKNGSSNRQLSKLDTMDGIEYEAEPEDRTKLLKSLERRIKQLQAKQGKGGDSKKRPVKKNKAAKFSKSNPGAYISAKQWKNLTEEQQAAARAARKKAGIPTRSIKAMTTLSPPKDDTPPEEEQQEDICEDSDVEVVEEMEEDSKPPARPTGASKVGAMKKIPPALLMAPQPREFATTQRQSLYANDPRPKRRAGRNRKVARAVVTQEESDAELARKIAALSS